jgi:hypothetical protein
VGNLEIDANGNASSEYTREKKGALRKALRGQIALPTKSSGTLSGAPERI